MVDYKDEYKFIFLWGCRSIFWGILGVGAFGLIVSVGDLIDKVMASIILISAFIVGDSYMRYELKEICEVSP